MIIAMAYSITVKPLKFCGNFQDARAGGEVDRFPTKGNKIRKQDLTGHHLCSSLRFKVIKTHGTWLVIVINKLTYL